MLNFIVLGQVPGTTIQIDFMLLLIAFDALICFALFVILVKHVWRRSVQTLHELLQIELVSL